VADGVCRLEATAGFGGAILADVGGDLGGGEAVREEGFDDEGAAILLAIYSGIMDRYRYIDIDIDLSLSLSLCG